MQTAGQQPSERRQPRRAGRRKYRLAQQGLLPLLWLLAGCAAEDEPEAALPVLGCSAASECPAGGPCLVPVCAQGTCGMQASADGEPCGADNRCQTGQTCSAGACQGGTARVCDDGVPCTSDGCDPATGCWFVATAAACDDNNLCTADSCSQTGCSHTPTAQSCSDGDPCTQGDACVGGQCVGSADGLCEDNNVCTTDSCDAEAGCVHVWNQAPCDDGDPATSQDTCKQGVCGGQLP